MESGLELCPVCAIWNTPAGFSKRLIPVWQRLVGEQFPELSDEMHMAIYNDLGLEHNELCWATILSLVTGKKVSASGAAVEDCSWDIIACLDAAERVARNADLALFRSGEIQSSDADSGLGSNLVALDLGKFTLAVHQRGIIVDGVTVRNGCGNLLFSIIAEALLDNNSKTHPAHRFNGLHNELCREDGAVCRNDLGQETIRRKMIRRQFQVIGDANAPPPFIQERSFGVGEELDPPPLCSWDNHTYSLGMHLNNSRHLLELPRNIGLLEFFVRTWRGRYGSESALKLRAACLELAPIFGQIGDNVPITPYERSFQLLRAVVEANRANIVVTEYGMLLTGTSGTRWWLRSGQGVHGSKCIIATANPRLDDPLDDPTAILDMVCLYEAKQHLPLGDRIVANLLGLLNDEAVASRIFQVHHAIKHSQAIKQRYVNEAER